MRNYIHTIIRTVAGAMGAALLCLGTTGCNEGEFEDFETRLSKLEAGTIPPVNEQLSGIEASITALRAVDAELRNLITALQNAETTFDSSEDATDATLVQIREGIASLEEKDAAVRARIVSLKEYADSTRNASADWVTTTFATLEQYADITEGISLIRNGILYLAAGLNSDDTVLNGNIDALEAAVEELETSLKTWVNGQLSGYWTIAQAQAKLDQIKADSKGVDDSLATEIAKLQAALGTSRSDLTTAYQAAIQTAITANNGVVTQEISDAISAATASLNAQIDLIGPRIDALISRSQALLDQLSAALDAIYSVVVIPDYSDGSVKMTGAVCDTLYFEVQPASAAASIVALGADALKLSCVSTLTRSSAFTDIPVTQVSLDGSFLKVAVNASGLPAEVRSGAQTANARLLIRNGTFTRGFDFFPLFFERIYVATVGSDHAAGVKEFLYGKYYPQETDGYDEFGFVYATSLAQLLTNPAIVRVNTYDMYYDFVGEIETLSNATYYYRSYAYQNGKVHYGEIMTFHFPFVDGITLNEAYFTMAVGEDPVQLYYEQITPDEAIDLGLLWESSDPGVATVNDEGFVTAVSKGWATIKAVAHDGGGAYACCDVKVYPEGAVDLGINARWASCNLGADSPEQYGDYYAWGETQTHYTTQSPLTWREGKTGYYWDAANYKWGTGSSPEGDDLGISKYGNPDYSTYWAGPGEPDGKTVLELEDDAAYVVTGGEWRMPTLEDWQDLLWNCNWKNETLNGVPGKRITGYNGNSIFIPIAGYMGHDGYDYASTGFYWSSSLDYKSTEKAYYFYFTSSQYYFFPEGRCLGMSIRPVVD